MWRKLTLLLIVCAIPLSTLNSNDECIFIISVKPDVLLILDTSGSMTYDTDPSHAGGGSGTGDDWGGPTHGDGSENYPGHDTDGDGLANDSRAYKLKEALHDVVSGARLFTSLGLMTFKFQQDGKEYPQWLDQYFYEDPMILPLPETTIVIDTIEYGHVNRPRSRRCWNVRVEDYPSWRYDHKWTVVETTAIWCDTLYDPPRLHYEGCGCQYGEVLVAPDAVNSSDSVLMWIDHKEDYPWDLSNPSEINKELRFRDTRTPIGKTMRAARDYFRDIRIPNDPAQECKRYFVIVITDGDDNCGQPNSVPAAQELREVTVGGRDYDIQTYVLAVAIDNPALDDVAEAGGTDHAYFADDTRSMSDALAKIFWDIRQKAFSFTAPEVIGLRGLRVGYSDRIYIASFIPSPNSIWEGHLKAYELPGTGILPVDEYGYPTAEPVWDAGDLLRERDPASRSIYTYKDGGLVDLSSLTKEDFGVPTDAIKDSIIATLYGEAYADLGDIFHSTPVLISNPNLFYVDEGYYDFRLLMRNTRPWTVYAGANDGMVHGFSNETGEEVWAFVPPNLLTKLEDVLGTHEYYVDGSPSASDVWFPHDKHDAEKTSEEWHTILLFGEREGGRYYNALDITDPSSPQFLFDFTDSAMAYTWSEPRIYKLKSAIEGLIRDRFYAFFGGGYWPDTLWDFNDPVPTGVKGNCIYFLNIWDAATGKDPIPYCHVITYDDEDAELDNMQYPVTGSPCLGKSGETRGMFLNRFEYLYKDLLWIGDLKGQLWRVDMRDPDPDNWTVKRLFVTNEDVPAVHRPIFLAPATAMDENGQRWVYFGTGNRADPCNGSEDNCFYAIKDGDYGDYLTISDLKRLSPSDSYDPAEPYMGWYVRFSDYGNGIGEKVYSSPVVLADTICFTTFHPDVTADPCEFGSGIARLYKFHHVTGGFGGDEPYEEIGSGIPQTPIVSTDMLGNTVLVISCGEGGITTIIGAPGEGKPKRTIWWRDIKGGPSRF